MLAEPAGIRLAQGPGPEPPLQVIEGAVVGGGEALRMF